jgi:hypothetical protein
MRGTKVELANAEFLFVAASPEMVEAYLGRHTQGSGLVRVGGRWINPQQVVQLLFEVEIPSIYSPERLELDAVEH